MALNGISTLSSKELKQKAKLNLAAANRDTDGNPRAIYDITLLPTQYSGNVVVDNPNPDGLVSGRPWVEFKVSQLFSAGEQGAWYDPSDFSTMFQDAAGTTPVTAVRQAVGLLLDKRKGLSLGSELVTNGTFDTNINGWTAGSASSNISWNNGKLRVSTTLIGTVGKSAYQVFPVVAGKWYLITGSATLIEGTVTVVQVALRDGVSAESSAVILSSNIMLHTLANGSFYYYADTTRTLYLHCRIFNTSQPCTVDFDNISGKEISGNHATQTTNTKRPVLQQDANGKYYLLFDGIDDALQTASINFTGTDKVTVWAGVRKLSDATGVLVDLSVDPVNNLNVFTLLAPSTLGANSYRFFSRGSGTLQGAGTGIFAAAPDTAVITGIGNINAPLVSLRRNGALIESNVGSQGTGNYGNYPIYIGGRSSGINQFNGRLYSLIVRGAQSTDTQITNTEAYVNSRTGAY